MGSEEARAYLDWCRTRYDGLQGVCCVSGDCSLASSFGVCLKELFSSPERDVTDTGCAVTCF